MTLQSNWQSIRSITAMLGVMAIAGPALRADFSYEQTTQVTGGSILRTPIVGGRLKEPTTQSVMLKGNRMIHLSKDRATVIDVDSETFMEINYEKKNYSVTTFAEMKQAMDTMAQRMAEVQGQKGQTMPEMTFKASVNDTGASKEINGVKTNQKILTVTGESTIADKTGATHLSGNIVESDMWLAPEVAGYEQVRAFYQRMGEKFGRTFGGAQFNYAPGMAKGFAQLANEAAKLKGIPVLQTTKVTQTFDGKPVAGMGGPQMPTRGQVGAAMTDSIAGGALRGLGGFGRKKKEEAPAQRAPADAAAAGPLMETTTQMSGFSSAALDASKFEAPAGFKQIESEMKKMAR